MKTIRPIPVLVFAAVTAMVACGPGDAKLQAAAESLSKAADACLQDVEDRNLAYEVAPNCSALGPLAMTYIEAGGFRSEPASVGIIAERARTTAWMARAIASPGGKGARIW